MTLTLEPPRFDWYAATVETAPETLLELAATSLGDEAPQLVKGQNGYAHGWEIRRAGSRAAVVYGGGVHDRPHIVGTGQDAESVAGLLRRRHGRVPHQVARADVCVDTDTPGAYVELRGQLLERLGSARGHELVPHDPDDGATTYVGRYSSEVMGRLYEKGKQLPRADRPDWVRFELQLRPQKARKHWAATATPVDLLGAARWSRRFAEEVLALAAARPPARSERVSDLDGAIETMTRQYGARILELLDVHGGDPATFTLELALRAENAGRLVS